MEKETTKTREGRIIKNSANQSANPHQMLNIDGSPIGDEDYGKSILLDTATTLMQGLCAKDGVFGTETRRKHAIGSAIDIAKDLIIKCHNEGR